MFNFFKKKEPSQIEVKASVREMLLGDVSMNEWPKGNVKGEPWSLFVEARNFILVQQKYQEAINIYRKITEMSGLESRHYLQAWHYLRKLGGVTPPPEVAKKVYGVLIDVCLANGTEFVAGYADHTARYFNYTGSGIVWEAPDTSLNAQIDALLKASEVAVSQIPPLNAHPNPPKEVDAVQICILTPSGLHHGIGTFAGWAKNESGGPIVVAATTLMKSLIDKKVGP